MQTFVSLFKGVPRESCTQSSQDIQWELVSSGYIDERLVPEPKYQVSDNYCIKEPPRCPKRLQRILKTAKFEARKTSEISFVQLIVISAILKGFRAAKVLPLFRMVTPESSSSDALSFVQYMDCTNPLKSLDKTLSCDHSRWSTEDEHDHTQG